MIRTSGRTYRGKYPSRLTLPVRPSRAIIDKLDLLRPIYRQSTNYGHFGRLGLPWEAVEKAAAVAK